MREIKYDELKVKIYKTRNEMGVAAGKHLEKILVETINEKGEARVIFASAPSQYETLNYLVNESKVDWGKVIGFHMDEYIGLPENSEKSFSKFIENKFFGKVKFKEWHPMATRGDIIDNAIDYLSLLEKAPIDLVILGVGENGHLAFIDPPIADFDDEESLKFVKLDPVNRQQQVNDGSFATLADVPTHALSMTIPFLMKSINKVAVVPGKTKINAIKSMLLEDVSTDCPASILRKHHSYLYTDDEAFQLIDN